MRHGGCRHADLLRATEAALRGNPGPLASRVANEPTLAAATLDPIIQHAAEATSREPSAVRDELIARARAVDGAPAALTSSRSEAPAAPTLGQKHVRALTGGIRHAMDGQPHSLVAAVLPSPTLR